MLYSFVKWLDCPLLAQELSGFNAMQSDGQIKKKSTISRKYSGDIPGMSRRYPDYTHCRDIYGIYTGHIRGIYGISLRKHRRIFIITYWY